MAMERFTWTTRARPIVQIGVGDSRIGGSGARWDVARWDDPSATWAGTEPTWLDITCDTISARCEYGRQRSTDRYVPGTATVVVWNPTGWADPFAATSPGDLSMRPGRAIRFGVWHQSFGERWLFRGFVDAMDPTYDPTDPDTVAFQCLDALGEVNRAKVPPLDPPVGDGDTVDQRIARLLDAANWPAPNRDLAPSGTALVATDLGGQLADLLGQAADSGGGAVFGDLQGRVAYRGHDWQMYLPGTPPNGTIGNVEKGHLIPAVPQVDGWLNGGAESVTTPDPGVLPVSFTVIQRARLTSETAANFPVTVRQNEGADPRSWQVYRNPIAAVNQGRWFAEVATTGAWASRVTRSTLVADQPAPATGADETVAIAITTDNGAGRFIMRSWTYDPTTATWTPHTSRDAGAAAVPFDVTTAIRVGTGWAATSRIYSMELRTGTDPSAGTVVWRFDANDYPGTGTSYVDPRGRTWTLSSATAITPKVPGTPAVWVPPDVCPVQWQRPFARADIATRVLIGRDTDSVQVLDDPEGQVLYGIEPFERTDLQTRDDQLLTVLGERVLRVRAASSAPRIRAVSLDARTSPEALDLMATVDPYAPSRYRCRLQYPPPRGLVFDAEHFATGVVHELTADAWTLLLNLDLSAPYIAGPGGWDGAFWDQALWSA